MRLIILIILVTFPTIACASSDFDHTCDSFSSVKRSITLYHGNPEDMPTKTHGQRIMKQARINKILSETLRFLMVSDPNKDCLVFRR